MLSNKKHGILIYERRELVAGTLLTLSLVALAFTYGLHVGKKVMPWTPELVFRDPKDHATLGTEIDGTPNRQELTEQGKVAPQSADLAMSEALFEETHTSGAKLSVPVQTELPDGSKSKNAGATGSNTGKTAPKTVAVAPKKDENLAQQVASPEAAADAAKQAAAAAAAGEKPKEGQLGFMIQVGSHMDDSDAQEQWKAMKAKGLPAITKSEELVNKKDPTKKTTVYRVYVGSFASKADAEKAAQGYKAEKKIGGYIIFNGAK
ncbi:MAG: SPOR domain-containing protein [Bdellovibrionales bacterium]|nr:SPOR domain-containing protein [Bdellovibrionales bacterium]